MNVLFVYYLPSGGVETLNRQRSAALKNRGISCHFLYYQNRRTLINDHGALTFITNSDEEIKRIIMKGKYKAIIITSDYRGLPRFRKLGYEGIIVFEIQGLGTTETARTEIQKAIPLIASYADGILVSKTPHILNILKDYDKTPPIFILNNCFNPDTFRYNPESQRQMDGSPIIAWIGRIEENKNWREFLQIGHKLITELNPKIRLFMFEDPTLSVPEERQLFNEMADSLQLRTSLTTLANVPHNEMADYLSLIGDSGGLLCSTSNTESFGYAIVEAMCCLCPVVSTKSDGVVNSIIHNETGKYYNIGNVEEAFNQCKELMVDKDLRKHIQYTAHKHINRHFSTSVYSQHFYQMIKNLSRNN
ncbi:glycosyltransferase family 4 protein [Cytobacillus firmus]|uniref:glycosyltransferase family 4 protein n=1 Tax=Cytobacillus firmus TaxID=1399 RepID=UPI001C945EF5|nr:glycosyltransferase [Cytobacillus firmus]MBY6053361.1 glycosyltransferase [Cytobacillus firmus]